MIVIERAVLHLLDTEHQQKILIVCNQVKRAQQLYLELSDRYPDVQRMLIHSRFKRGDRQRLEQELKNKIVRLHIGEGRTYKSLTAE